jgi:uncharacterized membrane protein YkoI
MKKLLIVPAIVGLIAVPSLALAQQGADDSQSNNVIHEDRTQNRGTNPAINTIETSQGRNSSSNEAGDDDGQVPAAPDGSISLDQAKAIALNVFPDKTIQKVELEMEHGVLVYSVRFTDDSRVDVRASDGVIVSSESEEAEGSDDHSGRSHTELDD